MEKFTIHIFGYGETQINSKELSVKVETNTLTSVQQLIDEVFAKKPESNSSLIDDYHAINIFNNDNVRWISKSKDIKAFQVKIDDTLKPFIDNLISELEDVKKSQ